MKINVEYLEGIPGEMDKYYFRKNKRNLIILDDLINEASKSLKITQLFTRGRHNNIFVIYLMLNLFRKNQRAISLNSNYMVIFRNTRDNSEFATIEGQIHPDIVSYVGLQRCNIISAYRLDA